MSAVVSVSTPGVLVTTMPALRGRLDVDVVVADAEVAEEPGTKLAVRRVGGQLVGDGREHDVGLGQRGPQPVAPSGTSSAFSQTCGNRRRNSCSTGPANGG